jgi:hypothetical protein
MISGLGGCKITSRPDARQAGKVSPRPPRKGSWPVAIRPGRFVDLGAERLTLYGQIVEFRFNV